MQLWIPEASLCNGLISRQSTQDVYTRTRFVVLLSDKILNTSKDYSN